MGLWLVQECRACGSAPYDELHRLARGARRPTSPLFDPDDDALPAPRRHAGADRRRLRARRPGHARRAARSSARSSSRSRASTAACSSGSRRVTGREVRRIHVIGGGARNALLCQLTADVIGREVLAGPVEATALGNVLVQARAAGRARRRWRDMRAVAAASAEPAVYEPVGGDQIYERFLAVTASDVRDDRDLTRAVSATLRDRDAVVGLRRLGHALRRVPAAGPPARRVRELDDAAEVHRLTGTAPRGRAALPVGRGRRLRRAARAHRGARAAGRRGQPEPLPGPRLQARLDHAPRRGACARRRSTHLLECVRDRDASSARPRSRCGSPTARTTRARTTCARAARGCSTSLGARLRGAAGRAGAAGRVQALRARVLRHRPRRLGLARC